MYTSPIRMPGMLTLARCCFEPHMMNSDLFSFNLRLLAIIDGRMCHLNDIAVSGDSRVESKENEKVQKYQDLARELRKLWEVKVNVVPVVEGALGTIPRALEIGTSVREGCTLRDSNDSAEDTRDLRLRSLT